jgi:hypothetical protein
MEDRKVKQVLTGELVPVGERGGCKERVKRVYVVEILCTHVCKWKMKLLKLF